MPHPSGCAPNASAWRSFLARLDARFDVAIAGYESESGQFSEAQWAEAYNELGSLGASPHLRLGEPDYELPAMPIVYALRYGIQRMTTVTWALDKLVRTADVTFPVVSVLDLASGLDAVSLALEATGGVLSPHQVLLTEPSRPMRDMADRLHSPLTRQHVNWSIESLLEQESLPKFDAIFLSYALSYDYPDPGLIRRLAAVIGEHLNGGGFVLYSGPLAKRAGAEALRASLESIAGMSTMPLPKTGISHLATSVNMPLMQNRLHATIRAAAQHGLLPHGRRPLYRSDGGLSKVFSWTTEDEVVFAGLKSR